MRRILFAVLFAMYTSSNVLNAQGVSTDIDSICYHETTTIEIDSIEEFLYQRKWYRERDSTIIFYVITGRFVDQRSEHYGSKMTLVSVDTISIQPEIGRFKKIEGISREGAIRIGETYLFHLRLWRCVFFLLGTPPKFYTVEGVRLPVQVCPHQPFKALELKGLNYTALPTNKAR